MDQEYYTSFQDSRERDYLRNDEGSYYDATTCRLIKRREVMSIIYIFVSENPDGKYPWTIFLSLIYFFALGQSNKIKIRHMVASEHTKVI